MSGVRRLFISVADLLIFGDNKLGEMEQHSTLAFAFFIIGESVFWGSSSTHLVDKELVLSFTLVCKIIIIKKNPL